jgi:hypothetical protein
MKLKANIVAARNPAGISSSHGAVSSVAGAREIDGGKFRFHAVTHMTLAADGQTLIYVSETGRRVMRYDLAARRMVAC